MPFFKVNAGFRIDDVQAARILAAGISPDILFVPVRVRELWHELHNTVMIIEADSEDYADAFVKSVALAASSYEDYIPPIIEDQDPPPTPLNVWGKVVQWTKSVGNATTTISGLTSAPKGIILFGTGLAGNAHGTFSEAGGLVIGFSDGTDDRDMAYVSQDNQDTSNCNRSSLDCAYHIVNPTGTDSTHISEKATITFGATSVDLNWSATTLATVGHAFIFGGSDITDVKVKDFTAGTINPVIQEYTGIGFRADMAMFLLPHRAQSLPWPTGTTGDVNGMLNISAQATDNPSRAWFTSMKATDNVGTTSTARYQKPQQLLGTMEEGTLNQAYAAKWKGFTNDGFFLDWSPGAPDATNNIFTGLFVKGGKWDAGFVRQPTTAVGTVTGLLQDPFSVVKAVLGFSIMNSTITAKNGVTSAKMGIGAQDNAGAKGYAGVSSNHNVGLSQEASLSVTDKWLRHFTATATASSSTTSAEATISNMSVAGQFTVDYTTIDSSARQTVWLSLSA